MTRLTFPHNVTREAIFQHPVARNLEWNDVRSMLIEMADSVNELGDVLKISRNGSTLVLLRPRRKRMDDVSALMKVRLFLEHTDKPNQEPSHVNGVHLLVVIDDRMARIYRIKSQESVPECIIPYDLNGSGRHLHHLKVDPVGRNEQLITRFFEAVAETLQAADSILIFGDATGAGSAMDRLVAELRSQKRHTPALVRGTILVNAPRLSEGQLLAETRSLYAKQSS